MNEIGCRVSIAGLGSIFLLMATFSANARALEPGSKAPEFEAYDEQGRLWRASDHAGRYVVLFFFPGDFGKGSVKQAEQFRDAMSGLNKKEVIVAGVSGDSVPTHHLFKTLYQLNYTLLSDESGSVAGQFGVPFREGGKARVMCPTGRPFWIKDRRKSLIVRRGVTTDRWTFIIGPDGKVLDKQTDVDPATEARRVADFFACVADE